MKKTETENNKPDLFRYTSYRSYLKDFYNFKKQKNKNFSFRILANQAGFSATSQFYLVMGGKRNITTKTLTSFARALNFNPREQRYFETLVQYEQADSPSAKKIFYEKLIPLYRKEKRYMLEKQYRYLSSWYGPVIFELVTAKGFREDPAWIAKKLKNKITPLQAKKTLQLLVELGLIKRDKDGGLLATETTLMTPDEVHDVAAVAFHSQMIDLAKNSINEDKHTAQKELIAMTTKISPPQFEKIQDILRECRDKIVREVEQDQEGDGEVFQVNLHLFSLTLDPDGNNHAT